MTAKTDRIHKKRKFDQGLEGAREAFLRDGFKPASVAPILRRAGVSKAMLYSDVPDKRRLFSEVMQRECDRLTGAARHEINLSTPAETVLKTAALHISPARLSGFYQAVFRICAANTDSRISARPATAPRRCGCAAIRHRNLVIGHEASAADRVVVLCKVDPYTRRGFRRGGDCNVAEIVGGSRARWRCSLRALAPTAGAQSSRRTRSWLPTCLVSKRLSSRTRSESLRLP